ncbi:MAG: hypothetical protein QM532_01705 [Cyanobium sp. MAG06]|nr:hypothetical protein [Cyanobium sp. MAG06]
MLNNLKSSTNTKDKTLLLEKINNIISNDNIVAPLYQNTRNVIIREDYSINLLSSINHYGEM